MIQHAQRTQALKSPNSWTPTSSQALRAVCVWILEVPRSVSKFFTTQQLISSDNSSTSLPMVGTSAGSKSFRLSGSIGTHTLPVFGCTTKGDFNKWFICLLTLISSLGGAPVIPKLVKFSVESQLHFHIPMSTTTCK